MLRATKIQTIISLGRRSLLSSPAMRFNAAIVVVLVVLVILVVLVVVIVDVSSPSSLFGATVLASSGRCSLLCPSASSLEADSPYGPSYVISRRFFSPAPLPTRSGTESEGRSGGKVPASASHGGERGIECFRDETRCTAMERAYETTA